MLDNSSVYKSKTRYEIMHFINARQKTYRNSTEIYIPNKPYEKLESGYEPDKKQTFNSGTPIATSEDEKLERTTRRAYIRIKDIVLSNDFDMFATFTFKNGRNDAELCKSRMSGWLKRRRKHDKSFQYVIVSEFHSDGLSLHFHALISGYTDNVVRAINPKTGKPLVKRGRQVYDFPNYTLGHSEIYYLGDTEEDRIKTGFYLMKYIKKDMPVFSNKKRYWASLGLNRPLVIDSPQEWYLALTPDHVIQMDYGKYLFFSNKRVEIFLP